MRQQQAAPGAQSLQVARTLCYFPGLFLALLPLRKQRPRGRGEKRWPPRGPLTGARSSSEALACLSPQNETATVHFSPGGTCPEQPCGDASLPSR